MAITPKSKGLGNVGAIVNRQGLAAPKFAPEPKIAPKPVVKAPVAKVAPKPVAKPPVAKLPPAPKLAPKPLVSPRPAPSPFGNPKTVNAGAGAMRPSPAPQPFNPNPTPGQGQIGFGPAPINNGPDFDSWLKSQGMNETTDYNAWKQQNPGQDIFTMRDKWRSQYPNASELPPGVEIGYGREGLNPAYSYGDPNQFQADFGGEPNRGVNQGGGMFGQLLPQIGNIASGMFGNLFGNQSGLPNQGMIREGVDFLGQQMGMPNYNGQPQPDFLPPGVVEMGILDRSQLDPNYGQPKSSMANAFNPYDNNDYGDGFMGGGGGSLFGGGGFAGK